jgi:NitT/TauT family transport system substrate-binding protein
VTLFLLGAVCPGMNYGQSPDSVKLVIPTRSISFAHFLLGREKGIFREEGIDLTVLEMRANTGLAALINGEVDFMSHVNSPVRAAARGMSVKVIFVSHRSPSFVLIAQPTVRSAADLKGKMMGLQLGGTQEFSARLALKHLGLDPYKDVTMVHVGADATSYLALKAGSIVASLFVYPYSTRAKREGFKELIQIRDILDLPVNGLSTSDRKLKENPALVKRMVRAVRRAMRYVIANKEEVSRFAAKEFGVDLEMAREGYEEEMKVYNPGGEISEKGILQTLEMMEKGLVGTVPISSLIDSSFLRSVQEEEGKPGQKSGRGT